MLFSIKTMIQVIVGCIGNPYIKPTIGGYLWVSYPQESLENTINTMVGYTVRGTPNCPLIDKSSTYNGGHPS